MADTVKGACLCGAVQFEVTLPTLGCCHCHCSICRRFSGAGYATFFQVSRERFRLLAGGGEPTALPFLAVGAASVLQDVREQSVRRAGWCTGTREYPWPYRSRARPAHLLGRPCLVGADRRQSTSARRPSVDAGVSPWGPNAMTKHEGARGSGLAFRNDCRTA